MSSDEENNINIHDFPTQNTNSSYSVESSDDELPNLDIPSLPQICNINITTIDYNNLFNNGNLSTFSTVGRVDVATTSTVSDFSDGQIKTKRKKPAEEVAENQRQATLKKTEKQREKEEKKAQKERETWMRKIESENKKAFRPGDCLKKITVCIDPGVINTNGNGGLIFKSCDDLGVKCETLPQPIPNSVIWKREVIETTSGSVKHTIEEDMLIMVPLEDFVTMVKVYSQKQKGDVSVGVTFPEFVQSLQCTFQNYLFTFFVHGVEKYFSDFKLIKKHKHKEAVMNSGTNVSKPKRRRKLTVETVEITRIELEETMVDTQLLTGCVVQFVDTNQETADLVKTFSKAVAEKPAKKGRLENVFNFLEEGTAGVKVDKNGQGLLKVFKHQLMQFKNLGPDMADAILGVYPSPMLLIEAYDKCGSEKEREQLLENIMVRRGGGVLATNRRVGKEMSRRVYLFLTTRDPNIIIK